MLIHMPMCPGSLSKNWIQLTLRDSSDRQSHSDLEVVDSTSDPGATVDRVVEMSNIDDPHGDANQ